MILPPPLVSIPSPIEVETWPQAFSLMFLIFAVLIVPGVLAYMAKRLAAAQRETATAVTKAAEAAQETRNLAEESRDLAEGVHLSLTTNNGGSHIKDQLDRIERRQESVERVVTKHLAEASVRDQRLAALEARPIPMLARPLSWLTSASRADRDPTR